MIYIQHQKNGNIWYSVAMENDQVVATCFSKKETDVNRLLQKLPKNAQFQVLKEPNQQMEKVLEALKDIFEGKNYKAFSFDTDLKYLSIYKQKVLKCTNVIPAGYVSTYGAIAKVAGGSARSVGNVQASNPVPLLVPCHRVVRSDLTIGGYGYGKQAKMEILQREDRGYEKSKKIKVNDKELALFPVKWIKQNRESF